MQSCADLEGKGLENSNLFNSNSKITEIENNIKIILMKLQNCQENSNLLNSHGKIKNVPQTPPPPNRIFFWKRHVSYI